MLEDVNAGDIISDVVGWTYFAAWSISFYPQVYMNWKRKSVVGLSFDYICYNIIGFSCYSAYTSAFYFSSDIQAQYKVMFGSLPSVEPNDVFFGLHAVLLTLVNIVQIMLYERGGQVVSKICMALCAGGLLSIVVVLILALVSTVKWIWFFYYLSMVKLSITLIKYIPQVWLNFKRKSTIGWNIANVLLDFTGGILSVAQLVFDCYRHDDWSGITGNIAKFLLGFLSMFFDIIFIVQHYILYRHSNSVDHEHGGANVQSTGSHQSHYEKLKSENVNIVTHSSSDQKYQPLTSPTLDNE